MKQIKKAALWMKNKFKMVVKYLNLKGKKGFSLLANINRPIIASQIDLLEESIKKIGVVRPVVIAKIAFISGKLESYIIDGQHLYMACLRLGINVPYVVIQVKDERDLIDKIALLNSSSKSWKMSDYVRAWAHISEDYIKLQEWLSKFKLEVSVLASIMSGNVGVTGQMINRKLKSGDFKVKNEKHNLQLVQQVEDVLNLLPRSSRFGTKYLCNEYLTFVKNCPSTGPNAYDHSHFLKGVKSQKDRIGLAIQTEAKLVDIFNKIHKNK